MSSKSGQVHLLCLLLILLLPSLKAQGQGSAIAPNNTSLYVNAFGAVNEIIHNLERTKQQLTQINSKLRESETELRKLRDEKTAAVAEMRRGEFCNQCFRSKSEIEKSEQFDAHLRSVKGERISGWVLDSAIREKAAAYDEKIDVLQATDSSLKTERAEASYEFDENKKQLQSALAIYHQSRDKANKEQENSNFAHNLKEVEEIERLKRELDAIEIPQPLGGALGLPDDRATDARLRLGLAIQEHQAGKASRDKESQELNERQRQEFLDLNSRLSELFPRAALGGFVNPESFAHQTRPRYD